MIPSNVLRFLVEDSNGELWLVPGLTNGWQHREAFCGDRRAYPTIAYHLVAGQLEAGAEEVVDEIGPL